MIEEKDRAAYKALTKKMRIALDKVYEANHSGSNLAQLDIEVCDALSILPSRSRQNNKFGDRTAYYTVTKYPKITTSTELSFKLLKKMFVGCSVNMEFEQLMANKQSWIGSIRISNESSALIIGKSCSSQALLWCALSLEMVLHLREKEQDSW